MTTVFIVFANFTTLYSVLLALLSLTLYTRVGKSAKVFAIYLAVAGSIDLVSYSFAETQTNNLMFFHLFTLMEIGILGVFFSMIFKSMHVHFRVSYLLYAVLGLVVFNSLFIQPLDTFNTYSATAVSSLVIGGCIVVFFKMINAGTPALLKGERWFLYGLLIYHMGSVIVLLMADILLAIDGETQVVIWIIRTFVILLAKLMFTYGLVQSSRQQREAIQYG